MRVVAEPSQCAGARDLAPPPPGSVSARKGAHGAFWRIAMGVVGAVCLASSSYAVKVSNSFVTVDGEGVGILDDGSITHDENSTGDITVTARPGWRVNGQKSVTINPARGSRQPLGATSDLHEDQTHVHVFPSSVSDEHVPDTYMEVSAEANPASDIKMYALPDTSTVVTVSATKKLVKTASHRKVTRYYKCACGAVHDPEIEYGAPYEVEPDRYVWKASGPGASFADSIWTGEMSKGLAQKIEFTVKAKRSSCTECDCEAKAEATVDVHELSVARPDYLGLNMTDAWRGKYINKSATAKIDPAPVKAEYEWQKCGRCEFYGATDKAGVTYRANDETGPSGSYLEEELIVKATARNKDGLYAEANCTTNFTVVKVDVSIGGVGEDKEESEGAFIPYVADATNGVISVEGTNKLVLVRLSCEPGNLPTNEMVRVLCAGPAELYQKLSDGELVRVASTNYFANEISNLEFVLHGHAASGSCKDGEIQIEHPTSGAVDVAKYTSVKVNVEITDFPTKTLLGEDKEEMPGAFIPYASDWAYGETPSNEDDIPFGPSAQEKLVDVYVSYEPADLPEHEDGGGKFLVFEAPSDSLYLPANSAGSDQLWMEFVDWWNTRPASWSLSFEGRKRLRLHGHEKSNSQRDREIRITHPKSGATDVAKYTVYHVDLDIDSDNDLAIENEDGFEDAIEEREPGKIISWDQSGISPGQDYRVPLRLNAWGGETNAVVRLEAVASSARVAEIYRTESGGNKLDLPFYLPADSIPPLYVDGVTNGTISITATLINPPEGVSAASSVRPIPGLELAKDKVAALVIQPISFSPGGGAAVWSSIPNGIGDGDGVIFDSIISNQGYKVTWYRDGNGEGDLGVGDCSANAYLNLDGYAAVTIISHGDVDEHLAVYFPNTVDGYNEATKWISDVRNSGGHIADMVVRENPGYYWYVSVKPQWFENNWKPGFDRRNSVVLWGSCCSASLLNCCGGRWRSGYVNPTDQGECSAVNSQFLGKMNGSIGAGTLRPMGLASLNIGSLNIGTPMCPTNTSVRMEGNPWTTLCPAPIIGNPTFPSSALVEGDVAFGCLLLDTFVKGKNNMIKVIAGDGVTGIVPLRQEGAEYPLGVGFRIKKGSGSIRVRSEAIKVYIESATPNDEFASGKTMDADRITPNGGIIEWEF